MKVLLLLAVCIAGSYAHLCMLSPSQRGDVSGINTKGADNCFRLKGPCGGQKSSMTPLFLRAGQNFTVIFQKNLDHWVKATPGHFSIMWGTEGQPLQEIGRIPDMGQPSLTLFSMNVMIPVPVDPKHPGNVLQTVYVTKNPKAPSMFFQCSDRVKLV